MAMLKIPNVPWLTEKGIDLSQVPLDGMLKRAVGEKREDVGDAVASLGSMAHAGRADAGIFLMGLLISTPDSELEQKCEIVRALRFHLTRPCAALLFRELRRVKSSNATRKYLDEVLRTLDWFPRSWSRAGSTSWRRIRTSRRRCARSSGGPPGRRGNGGVVTGAMTGETMYQVPTVDHQFMVRNLRSGELTGESGVVRHCPEFAAMEV